ncbi:AIM24 family protein (plasmid) [Georgenia sp. TF02-10]|uniref:AIM24 family protein n=1 Tax=Georgenia sp. TF02-10 TaxID=2917725 RepID=UPI001FA75B1F|nr:AIM24 family protein [Georgenia sp. TF02-10]UNX56656.1 AIM24 family protein [Georgenia sp. TF02-10]
MTAAAWHPDPTGRHELRYWDGTQWTEHVSDGGVQSVSPLAPPEEPGAHTGTHATEPQDGDRPAPDQPADQPVGDGDAWVGETRVVGDQPGHEAEQPAFGEAPPAVAPVAAQPAGAPYGGMPGRGLPGGGAGGVLGGTAGISGDLIDGRFSEKETGPGPALQNSRLLRVRMTEPFMARQGAMVAYQGQVSFAYQGGGAAKFFKKALTGEGLPLMRVEGQGDVFLAEGARHVHVLHLNGSGISVNGANVLAFSAGLDWNIERVKGGSIAAGGLFNTALRGTGWVAITTDGEPVVLNAAEAPTFADMQAIVAWSIDLQTSIHSSFTAGALIGRGSGEAFQVAFGGHGFVIVQPSEGAVVPPHNH